MIRAEDMTSVAEHRGRLRDHLRQVNETGRPLFITANGETEAVVLSPAAYEALADQAELARSVAMVEASMEDIKAGRTINAKQAIHEIAEELGLSLERRPARKRTGA